MVGGLGFDRLLAGFRRVCFDFDLESLSESEVSMRRWTSSESDPSVFADRLIDFRPDLVEELERPFLSVRREEEEEAPMIWKSESESEVVSALEVWVSAMVISKSLSLSALALVLALSLGLRVDRMGLVVGDVRGDVVVIFSGRHVRAE
jgi:hypothetical protein